MQHYRQSKKACLAYALLQIGAVEASAVADYERFIKARKFHTGNILEWTGKHAPWCKIAEMHQAPTGIVHPKEAPIDLSGTGLLIINFYRPNGRKIQARHAVSFENGLILDPADATGRLRTLSEYSGYCMGRGARIAVCDIWRKPA